MSSEFETWSRLLYIYIYISSELYIWISFKEKHKSTVKKVKKLKINELKKIKKEKSFRGFEFSKTKKVVNLCVWNESFDYYNGIDFK